jgi:hypothetical protein
MRLHVHDSSGKQGASMFEDLSAVPKYEISEEAYAQRQDSYRKFKVGYGEAACSWTPHFVVFD